MTKKGYFFGLSKLPPDEEKAWPLDHTIKNTLLWVIRNFLLKKALMPSWYFIAMMKIKKEAKRAAVFNRWYEEANADAAFVKYDEEIIVVNSETGEREKSVYISIVIERTNAAKDAVLAEFQLLRE